MNTQTFLTQTPILARQLSLLLQKADEATLEQAPRNSDRPDDATDGVTDTHATNAAGDSDGDTAPVPLPRKYPAEILNDTLARIIWSQLTEPGDAIAGILIKHLGSEAALDTVLPYIHEIRHNSITPQASAPTVLNQLLFQQLEAHWVSHKQITAALARWEPRYDPLKIIKTIQFAIAKQLKLLTPTSKYWPKQVEILEIHKPYLLWVRGNPSSLAGRKIAIVGARAASNYGERVTAEIVASLTGTNTAVVSGGAFGIDATAHRAALHKGIKTIAVLAGGVDRNYPIAHTELFNKIIENGGCVISELLPGSIPTRWRFLQRNRVIAALADATVVTEAGIRSGSLNTAGHTCQIGRSLGAVPGQITAASSVGCHKLIREYDAKLITSGQDIKELLGLGQDTTEPTGETGQRETSINVRVLDALPKRGYKTVAEVAAAAGLSYQDTRQALAELLLSGKATKAEYVNDTKWRLAQ